MGKRNRKERKIDICRFVMLLGHPSTTVQEERSVSTMASTALIRVATVRSTFLSLSNPNNPIRKVVARVSMEKVVSSSSFQGT